MERRSILITPSEVKPFLAHPDPALREFAAEYFYGSFNKDADLMPLVLANTLSEDEEANRKLLAAASRFTQSKETLLEVLNRLEHSDKYLYHYSNILFKCDHRILESLPKNALEDSYLTEKLKQKKALSKLSTEELWQRIFSHTAIIAEKGFNMLDFESGKEIVTELALREDLSLDRLLQGIAANANDNEFLVEVYLIMLAGEMRLNEAVPLLIDKLNRKVNLVCAMATEALAKIGTSDVIKLLTEHFLEQTWDFKIYAAQVFGQIKLAQAEDAIWELFPEEENQEVATILAGSLCRLASKRGIPLVKSFIAKGYSHVLINMEEIFYACSVINGVDLPELKGYQEMIKQRRAEVKARLDEEFRHVMNLQDKEK